MTGTLDMIDKLLVDLKNVGGVMACAAASRDGLLIRSLMQKEQYVESLAAMSATMLGAAETATIHAEMGIPTRVIVESDIGKLIVEGAGPKALLILLANKDSGLGLILLELDRSSQKLKEILK
ncbi:MAG: roadblock/LC7 domain-containing protein [Candidatus Methanoperedens sp.]|nr:roadblock/LC7 domain-containing protein [Candidatus Methanoperedens sp.]